MQLADVRVLLQPQRLELGIPGSQLRIPGSQQVQQLRVRTAKLLNQPRSGYVGHKPRSSPHWPKDQAPRLRVAPTTCSTLQVSPTPEWTRGEALRESSRIGEHHCTECAER